MNEFFTKISSQIAGPIILGTFFPVVLFVTLFGLVVLPTTPYGQEFTDLVKDLRLWQEKGLAVIIVTFAVLVLTVVLYHLNTPVIRLYEGYTWKGSMIGRIMTWSKTRKFRRMRRTRRKMVSLNQGYFLEGISGVKTDIAGAQEELALALNNEYPFEPRLVLPTRLGNVIRSFETYTKRQYNADAIPLWPRLQGVLDGNFAQALDATKTGFDFMLNSSLLTAALALLLSGAGLWWKHPHYYGWRQGWVAWAVIFAIASRLLYVGAINRAAEWGQGVKAAFDLYRLVLLQKLGYEVKLTDPRDERRMWEAISYKFIYPDDDSYSDLSYVLPQTAVRVDPPSVGVTFTRSVSTVDADTEEIRIVVSNLSPIRSAAAAVLLREQIAPEHDYVPGSASVDGAPCVLSKLVPLEIPLGAMAYNDSRVVVYRLKKQVKK